MSEEYLISLGEGLRLNYKDWETLQNIRWQAFPYYFLEEKNTEEDRKEYR